MAQAKDESTTPTDGADDEIVIEDPDEIVVEEAPTDAAATSTATLTDEKAETPSGGERVVFVSTPEPPRPRSNRVVGALLALAGAVLFAVLDAAAAAVLLATVVPAPGGFGAFVRDAAYWVPVLFFTVAFVLVVLLLNRAAWWLHVLGSILVAAVVYFGSIGVLLLLNGFASTGATFATFATSPLVIAAALVAREVSIWVGFLIAWRGGRVKQRNRAAREAFDAENAPAATAKTDGAAAASA